LVHLPVHASWLNQIEIYFSIVQRKGLTPNDFTDLAEVQQRMLGSSAATSRPRCHSIGASPEPIWTTCSGDPTRKSSSPKQHDVHSRRST
jgi:hypothetical protein